MRNGVGRRRWCGLGPAGLPAGCLACLLATAVPNRALAEENLLVNGSFEVPVVPPGRPFGLVVVGVPSMPGWRITRGTVDVKRTFWQHAPGQGFQSLDLVGSPGAGTISQIVATEVGRDYVFSGWLAHNPGRREGRTNVFVNSDSLTQLLHTIPSSVADMHWSFFAHRFRANTPETSLTLTDVTGLSEIEGTALDGLTLRSATADDPLFQKPAHLFVAAIEDVGNVSPQVFVYPGQCVTLTLVVPSGPNSVVDVTYDPATTFVTTPGRGLFSRKNLWCATPADVERVISISGVYRDPRTGAVLTDSVFVSVKR